MANPDDCASDVFRPDGRLRIDLLDEASANVLRESVRLARETHWDRLRSPHVFMGLLAFPDAGVRYWGKRLGADLPELLEQFQELFHQGEKVGNANVMLHREFLSDNVIGLLREARFRAFECGRAQITSLDLLISLLTAPKSFIAECFEHFGYTAAKLTEWAVMAEYQGSPGLKSPRD